MKKITTYIFLAALVATATSCHQQEVFFDEPFFYVTDGSGLSSGTIDSRAVTEEAYIVKLSAPRFDEPVTLRCALAVGDGLTEGVDYELLSPLTIVFTPGLYEAYIRIEWLANPVDPAKDNSLTIELKDNSAGWGIGFPGPDGRNASYTVTKENRN